MNMSMTGWTSPCGSDTPVRPCRELAETDVSVIRDENNQSQKRRTRESDPHSPRDALYFGRVIAPSDAEETSAPYLPNTPVG